MPVVAFYVNRKSPNRCRLGGFFAALAFVFLLAFFELLLELGPLLGLDFVALLLLHFELLFGAEKLDEGLFAAIALAESSADDAQLATLAVPITPRHGFKQPLYGLIGHEKAEGLTARVQIALLAQGNHLFNQRTNSLGLGHGGLHAVFHEDRRDQVAQQSAAVAGVASELESCIAMAHG